MTGTWPWLVVAGLGVYHGINPAMGWLFAVALGLQRQSRPTVLWSLLPIGVGHAVAVGSVVLAVALAGTVIDAGWLRRISGALLIAWAVYHAVYGHRHRVRVGMRTGLAGLFVWSFFMAMAHGAGLMLVPALMPLGFMSSGPHAPGLDAELPVALGAVALHAAAMLVTTGIVAVIVYEWVGLAFLRRGWINLDVLWTAALLLAGSILLIV